MEAQASDLTSATFTLSSSQSKVRVIFAEAGAKWINLFSD